jgi:hypothetical protein
MAGCMQCDRKICATAGGADSAGLTHGKCYGTLPRRDEPRHADYLRSMSTSTRGIDLQALQSVEGPRHLKCRLAGILLV